MRVLILIALAIASSSCSDTLTPGVQTGGLEGRALLSGADDSSLILVSTDDGEHTAATTADGRYRLSGLAAGTYRLSATREGYASVSSEPMPVIAGDTNDVPDLVLSPRLTVLSGAVRLEGRTDHGNATVHVGDTGLTATSAADGSFTVPAVPPGTHVVSASADGFATAVSAPFVLVGQSVHALAPLVLRVARGELRGLVRLADRADNSGIFVTLQGHPWATFTTPDGAYVFRDIPVGQYSVVATLPGYATDTVTDVSVDADGTTEVRLLTLASNPATLTGTVRMQGATTHIGIDVTVAGSGVSIVTEPDGTYLLTGLAPGVHVVTASHAGFVTASSSPIIVAAGETGVVPPLTLQIATGHLQGQVELVGANDDAGVYVVLRDTPYAAITTPSGVYRFDAIPVGQYTVAASHPGFFDASATDVTVAADVTTAVQRLVLAPNPGTIRGRATLEGVAAAGIALSIPGTAITGTTDALGAFELGQIPPGVYFVTASSPLHDPVTSQATSVGAGGSVTLADMNLPRSRGDIEGVVDLAGVDSAEGVQVTLANTAFATLTPSSGAYRLTGVPVGQYTIVASKLGFTSRTASDVEVHAHSTTTAPALLLAANPGEITGTATLEGASNHGGITISVLGLGLTTSTDNRGAFRLTGVPPGTHFLSAERATYEAASSQALLVTAGGALIAPAMALARSRGSIAGQVDVAGTSDDSGVYLALSNTPYATLGSLTGTYLLENIPTGQYTLVASRTGFSTASASDLVVLANTTTTAPALILGANPGAITGTALLEGQTDHSGTAVTLIGTGITSTTDARGAFSVTGVPAGTHSLRATRAGYDTTASTPVVVQAGATVAAGAITLSRARGDLTGRVDLVGSDDDSGAIIAIQGTAFATISNAAGGFAFARLPVGQYAISISKAGYTTAAKSDIAVVADTTSTAPLVALQPAPGSVSGSVALADGGSPNGVVLRLDGTSLEVVAGSDGSFILSDVPMGFYTLTALHPGYEPARSGVFSVDPGVDTAIGALALVRSTGGLGGQVDVAGAADDSGVLVTLLGTPHATLSSPAGTYAFSGIATGQYTVVASLTGFTSASISDVSVTANATTTVALLALAATPGSVSGTVALEGGASPNGVIVRVDGTSLQAVAAADGKFAIAGVPIGYHTLTATHPGHDPTQSNLFQVEPGKNTVIAALFMARATGGLGGIATLSGRSDHSGIEVVVLGTAYTAITAANGSWQINGLPAAGYSVRFSAAAFASVTLTDQTVSPNQQTTVDPVQLVQSPGVLTGVALRRGSDNHLGILVLVNGTAFQGGTDENGAWTIGGIPAGTYTLQYEAQDHKSVTSSQVQVLAGQTLAVGTVSLDPAEGKVQGWVTQQGRSVYTGVQVTVTGGGATTTDPQGRWEMTIPIGNYTGVTAASPPYFAAATYNTNFTVTKQGIANIPLLDLAMVANDVHGVVGIYGSNDASGVLVRLQGRDPVTAGIDRSVMTDSTGVYAFVALPLGEYRVTLSYLAGWETWTEDFDLVAGPGYTVQTRELAQRYIRINNDATWSKNASVLLSLGSSDAVKMCLRNDAPATCPEPWVDFAPSVVGWPLSTGDGDKQVCATFRDSFGVDSVPICDAIKLDTNADITSLTFSPAGPLTRGSVLHAELTANELYAGTATLDIGTYAVGIVLRDNGLNGDTLAGDHIYSADYRIADSRDVPSPGATLTGRFRDWLGNEGTRTAGPVIIGSPPRISDLLIVPDSATQSATVTWTTDEPATTKLRWGTSAAYGDTYEPSTSLYVTQHTAVLTGLAFGTEYHLRAYGSDAAGNEGFSLDKTFYLRPNPPSGVVAMPGDGRFDVRWEAPPQADVVGYNVYKASTSGGPYAIQNSGGPFTNAALMFSEVPSPNDVPSYWVVTSVDAAANESEYSAEVAGTPSANAGPTSPCGLITGVTVWSTQGSPYAIACNLVVEDGATLVIGPGVQVSWTGKYVLRVDGNFAVLGTEASPVVMGAGGAPAGWADQPVVWFTARTGAFPGIAPGSVEMQLLTGHFEGGDALLHRVQMDHLIIDAIPLGLRFADSLLRHTRIIATSLAITGSELEESAVYANSLTASRSTLALSEAVVAQSCRLLDSEFAEGLNPVTCADAWVERCLFRDNASASAAAALLIKDPICDGPTKLRAWVADSHFIDNERLPDPNSHYNSTWVAAALGMDNSPPCGTSAQPVIRVRGSEFRGNRCVSVTPGDEPCTAAAIAIAEEVVQSSFVGNPCDNAGIPCGESFLGGTSIGIVTHAVSNEHSDAGSPIGAANEVIASSFTLPVESPAALWRDWAASFNWSLVFRWNQIAVATVGGVNLEQRHPNSAAAFSGNSFIGSGSPRIETTYSSLDGQSFMQDNYWGPTTTAEMDTKGAAANISAFHDIWEDALLGRILYDDWAATAYPMPQIDSPGFGAIVELGEPIHFNGFADDLEDGPIPGAQLSWYSEEAGELGTGNALTRFDLSIGTHKVWLTATDSSGQQSKTWTKVVVKSAVTDVTTDTDHGCGLSGGGLWCWGNNQDGQLGVGTYSDSAVPVRVGSEQDWTSVSAGFSHTCALRGGAVWCWGNNQWGQLGDGPTESRPVPNRVGATNDWTEIVAGYSESCGLKSGQLWCWGLIGDPWPTPVDSANDWTAVTLGLNFACGIRAGQLWCWGNNSSGQLGDGTKGHRTTPTRVGSATDWSAVSAGSAFTCGVRVGTLWCWGENGAGEAGLGAAGSPFLSPVQLGSASDWSALATGDKHACAVRNGTLWCWGSNQDGRRGDNVSDLGIRQVGFADAWSQVACGRQHTCGLLGRDLWCWGRNSAGQVGSGDPVGVLLPPVPIRF